MMLDVQPGCYPYPNVIVRGAYDGDTVYLDLDRGMHDWCLSRAGSRHPRSYRLLDIDAPELRPLVTRQAATEARDYLLSLLGPLDTEAQVIAQTYRAKDDDDFGRYLVHLWRASDGLSINRAMIDSGHAVGFSP